MSFKIQLQSFYLSSVVSECSHYNTCTEHVTLALQYLLEKLVSNQLAGLLQCYCFLILKKYIFQYPVFLGFIFLWFLLRCHTILLHFIYTSLLLMGEVYLTFQCLNLSKQSGQKVQSVCETIMLFILSCFSKADLPVG